MKMQMRKSLQGNKAIIFIGFFIALIGMIIFGVFSIIFVQNNQFKKQSEPITATISDYKTTGTGNNRNRQTIVDYAYNDKTYSGELGWYNSGSSIGDSVEIYVRPGNPLDIRMANSIGTIVGIAIGAACMFIGLVILYVHFSKRRRRKNLIERGQKMHAEIVEVSCVKNFTLNERHPYKIYCRGRNPKTGQEYMFESHLLWEKPFFEDDADVTYSVIVYTNPSNEKKYFVDEKSIYTVSNAFGGG